MDAPDQRLYMAHVLRSAKLKMMCHQPEGSDTETIRIWLAAVGFLNNLEQYMLSKAGDRESAQVKARAN
jgi:hypothetical protein